MQLLTFIQESCARRHHGPKPNQRGVEPEAAERYTKDQLEEGVYAWMRIKVEATVFFFILERPSYCQCVVLRGQEDRPRARRPDFGPQCDSQQLYHDSCIQVSR